MLIFGVEAWIWAAVGWGLGFFQFLFWAVLNFIIIGKPWFIFLRAKIKKQVILFTARKDMAMDFVPSDYKADAFSNQYGRFDADPRGIYTLPGGYRGAVVCATKAPTVRPAEAQALSVLKDVGFENKDILDAELQKRAAEGKAMDLPGATIPFGQILDFLRGDSVFIDQVVEREKLDVMKKLQDPRQIIIWILLVLGGLAVVAILLSMAWYILTMNAPAGAPAIKM